MRYIGPQPSMSYIKSVCDYRPAEHALRASGIIHLLLLGAKLELLDLDSRRE